MTNVVKWEDPPVVKRNKTSEWEPIADELRTNPKRWALIQERPLDASAPNAAVQLSRRIRRGETAAFRPSGSFECAVRNDKGAGRVKVYARYIGEP